MTTETFVSLLEPIARRYRHNTRLVTNYDMPRLVLNGRPIVVLDTQRGRVVLDTGGCNTATTARRMNAALDALGVDLVVYRYYESICAKRLEERVPGRALPPGGRSFSI